MLTPAKSSEVPAARQLLRRLNLDGKTVLSDALHTTIETAQQIIHEHGADYLMPIKGNQPTLQQTLETLFAQQGFSPSPQGGDPSH